MHLEGVRHELLFNRTYLLLGVKPFCVRAGQVLIFAKKKKLSGWRNFGTACSEKLPT